MGGTPPASPVASPCDGTCRLDGAGLCLGCRRTMAEIAAWPAATEAERRLILEAAARRRA